MSFPGMPAYVRNDPLGPVGHNNIISREGFVGTLLGAEHDLTTGEHNTPLVPRTLGCVSWSGAAYSLEGFNGDVTLESGHNPTPGTVILTLAADRFSSESGVLEVQCASDDGDTTPSLATAKFTDDTHVAVYLKEQTLGLGVQQIFDPTDMTFFIGVRSPRLTQAGEPNDSPTHRQRNDGLSADSPGWNAIIQRVGDHRYATLIGHASNGAHDTREIAKCWGFVRWDWVSSLYVVASHQGLGAGVERIAQGHIRIYLANAYPAMSTPVEAFAEAVNTMNPIEDTHHGIVVPVVPASTCVAQSVDVFLYEGYISSNIVAGNPVISYRWRRVDCDFFVRVHGA